MKQVLLIILFYSLLIGCSSAERAFQKSTQKVFNSSFYENQFTGFLVVNSQNKDTLLNFNGKKYFTPASNTKIFTLFTALALLPDSIPALKYIDKNEMLYVEGTGDPTFLHTFFEQNETANFLKKYENISLYLENYKEAKLGSGWAWDDYHYYYQPELGPFPLYGNVTTIRNSSALKVIPRYFKDSVVARNSKVNRKLDENKFFYASTRKDTVEIPYLTNQLLTKGLLEKELGKKVTIVKNMPEGVKSILYSHPKDTVLRRMMHESDNFVAEQLLILASSTLSDTLSSATARTYILENQLSTLKQKPRWVDGSGLSRYNLFTPESIVDVLSRMYANIPREKLFSYFPTGGLKGSTLEDWYPGDPNPYIYAKSGTLGNVHCLSGYLLTKSGKTLIFSFMNNHFRHPSSEIKKQMQLIFEEIRDTY